MGFSVCGKGQAWQALIALAAGLSACGAPAKKASDVSGIFETETLSLQQKMDDLCGTMKSRTAQPSASVFTEGNLNCGGAGNDAQNLSKIDRFSFVGVDSNFRPAERTKGVKFMEVRSEVWLNQNILGMASKIGDIMKKGLDPGGVSFGGSGSNNKLAGLVTPKVEVLEKPAFDQKTFEFSMKIHFQLEGLVKADHIIVINGKLIDKVIAVTAATTEDQEYKKSVLQNFQAAFLIVPHASDVYVDMNIKLNVHDLGVGDDLLKDNIHKALSSGMKAALDSLLGLK